jgi:hypothetical protein
MKNTLSFHFESDITTICGLSKNSKGLELLSVDTVHQGIPPLGDNIEIFKSGLSKVLKKVESQIKEAERITISLPAETSLAKQIPYIDSTEEDKLRELLTFEIELLFPKFTVDDFYVKLFPIEGKNKSAQMQLAILMEKNLMQVIQDTFEKFGKSVDVFQVRQLAAHATFMYNYPESITNTVVILGIQEKFLDVSILREGKLIYYDLASFNSIKDIGTICQTEITKLLSGTVSFIDNVYLFGNSLTAESLSLAHASLFGIIQKVERINAFRMITTNLDQRTKEYCSRTSHLFVPCIGSALLDPHKVSFILE